MFSQGAPIAEGRPDDIRQDPAALDAYLGEEWKHDPIVRAAGPDPETTLSTIGND